MVECLNLDKGAVGLSLTLLFPYAIHIILYLILVQPRKRPDMAENFLTGMGGSRGGVGVTGGTDPLKDHKKGFLGNIGPYPLENRKATRPEFNVRPSSERQRNTI